MVRINPVEVEPALSTSQGMSGQAYLSRTAIRHPFFVMLLHHPCSALSQGHRTLEIDKPLFPVSLLVPALTYTIIHIQREGPPRVHRPPSLIGLVLSLVSREPERKHHHDAQHQRRVKHIQRPLMR